MTTQHAISAVIAVAAVVALGASCTPEQRACLLDGDQQRCEGSVLRACPVESWMGTEVRMDCADYGMTCEIHEGVGTCLSEVECDPSAERPCEPGAAILLCAKHPRLDKNVLKRKPGLYSKICDEDTAAPPSASN